MATKKVIVRKISRTAKRYSDNVTVFRGPKLLASTTKTDNS